MREPLAKRRWWCHLVNNFVLAEVPAGYDCFLISAAVGLIYRTAYEFSQHASYWVFPSISSLWCKSNFVICKKCIVFFVLYKSWEFILDVKEHTKQQKWTEMNGITYSFHTGCSRKKTAQRLRRHNFATVRHKVVRFSAKCLERNCLRVSECGNYRFWWAPFFVIGLENGFDADGVFITNLLSIKMCRLISFLNRSLAGCSTKNI